MTVAHAPLIKTLGDTLTLLCNQPECELVKEIPFPATYTEVESFVQETLAAEPECPACLA